MVPVFFSSSTVSKDNYFLVEKKIIGTLTWKHFWKFLFY